MPWYEKTPKWTAESKLDDTVPDTMEVKKTVTVAGVHRLGIIWHDYLLPEINTYSTAIRRQSS